MSSPVGGEADRQTDRQMYLSRRNGATVAIIEVANRKLEPLLLIALQPELVENTVCPLVALVPRLCAGRQISAVQHVLQHKRAVLHSRPVKEAQP